MDHSAPFRSRIVPFGLMLALFATSIHAAELLSPEMPIESAIDHYIKQRLVDKQILPSPVADDTTLVRRTTLDLAGRIPTLTEAQAYVNSTDADKRPKLVEQLMASPDFALHFRNELNTVLMGGQKGNSGEFRDYLLRSVRQGRSWDQMFRDMLIGNDEDPETKGALTFVKSRVKELDEITNETSVIFFGVNVSCAKCHDHPLVSDWKQDHYFGMASFFQRTYQTKKNGLAEKFSGEVKFKTTKGEDKVAKFMFLTGTTIDEPVVEVSADVRKQRDEEVKKQMQDDKVGPPSRPDFSPRTKLVELALKPENETMLARNIVNRVWAMLIGRGLVHPLDQMHSGNPASHPDLLEWLTRDLIAHKYDLRRVVRGIVLSEVYARSSEWSGSTETPAPDHFAVALVRPLSPRQYALSLQIACERPDNIASQIADAEKWLKRREELDRQVEGVANQFELPGENFQVGVDEALLFANSPQFTENYLRDNPDRIVGVLKQQPDHATRIATAYWAILSRNPSPDEVAACEQYLAKRDTDQVAALRQMTWALLTSPELRFNH